MPLIALACQCGGIDEQYVKCWQDYGVSTRLCACGHTMGPALSVGRGLTYFEEGRARTIANLGGATITSHRQHDRVMRERGVEMATEWHTSKRGAGVARQMSTPVPPPSIDWSHALRQGGEL
jgi:hypothetical protein